jgi:hypothetical protein
VWRQLFNALNSGWLVEIAEQGRTWSVFKRSMPSDLIRGWIPVRVKKTRQTKNMKKAGAMISRRLFLID